MEIGWKYNRNSLSLPTVGRILVLIRIPTLYFVPDTWYNLHSQSCHIFLFDVSNLFLPFDFIPDILGGLYGNPVAWLH